MFSFLGDAIVNALPFKKKILLFLCLIYNTETNVIDQQTFKKSFSRSLNLFPQSDMGCHL